MTSFKDGLADWCRDREYILCSRAAKVLSRDLGLESIASLETRRTMADEMMASDPRFRLAVDTPLDRMYQRNPRGPDEQKHASERDPPE